MKLNWRRDKLDEQQEQKLLKIESRGLYLAYIGLLVEMVAKMLLTRSAQMPTGEWILFMLLSVYMIVACTRAGIWDRRLDTSRRTSVIVAGAAALLTGAFMALVVYLRGKDPLAALAVCALATLVCFVLCYLGQRLGVILVRKRQEKLNAEPENEEED